MPGSITHIEVGSKTGSGTAKSELGGEAGPISPEEPGFGRFCSCRDREGVSFGLHQAAAG
jgi:uncharacterized protein